MYVFHDAWCRPQVIQLLASNIGGKIRYGGCNCRAHNYNLTFISMLKLGYQSAKGQGEKGRRYFCPIDSGGYNVEFTTC